MIFYPAIDISNGKCVRLKKGLLRHIKYYSSDPIEQSKNFKDAGCIWLHIVDIDGAFKGEPVNEKCIFKIKKESGCNIQVGGGIRSINVIEKYLENSVDRIILGTIALIDPGFVIEACKKFPNKIAVGIDSKNNMVSTNGWAKNTNVSTEELAQRFEDVGVSVIIFTDINKDGLLEGMNFRQIKRLTECTTTKIIASGGVSTLLDLKKLKKIKATNLEGVIAGKAIYEGKFSVKKALEILK